MPRNSGPAAVAFSIFEVDRNTDARATVDLHRMPAAPSRAEMRGEILAHLERQVDLTLDGRAHVIEIVAC